jgi:hypothetical protein
MGEGFGADVANACYVGIGGVDEGMGMNFIDDGLDCFFGGFFAEEGEDLLAFETEWCIYSLVS